MSRSSLPGARLAAAALGLAIAAAACGAPAASPAGQATPEATAAATPAASPSEAAASPTVAHGQLTIYSGRSEKLVGPILEQFETQSGIDIEVRYGDTSELAATILEEGDNSPADVFFSQDGGALGALANEGRLAAIPQDVLDLVDPRFRSKAGQWVGVSGRARVLAYDTRELQAADLPASVLDLAKPEWKGRVAWVPTNASFQTFVTALRTELGDEAAKDWLVRMQANEPKVYEGNSAALQAVRAGEVDVALVNHYYLFQAQREAGEDFPVANHFFEGGDPGALVNVAGVGVLSTTEHTEEAETLVRFLLGEEAQTYFATQTFEYPLRAGMTADDRLPALADIQSPDLDLSELSDLEGTLRLLQEAGVL